MSSWTVAMTLFKKAKVSLSLIGATCIMHSTFAIATDLKLLCATPKEEWVVNDTETLEAFKSELEYTAEKPQESLQEAVVSENPQRIRAALMPLVLKMLRSNVRMAPDSRQHPFLASLPGSDGVSFPYTVPSSKTYGTASWFHDLVYGAFQCDRASQYLRKSHPKIADALDKLLVGSLSAVLQNQIGDGPNQGLIGHMNYLHETNFVNTFGHQYTSNISQPPVLATMIERLNNRKLSQQYAEALIKNAEWWIRQRLENSLISTSSPWELGTDALNSVDVSLLPKWGLKTSELMRNETDNSGFKDLISKNARFNIAEAIKKAGGINASGEDLRRLMNHKSTAMNSYVVMSLRATANILSNLAKNGGNKAEYYQQRARQFNDQADAISEAVNSKMWSESHSFYYSIAEKPNQRKVDELVRKGIDPNLLKVEKNGHVPIKVLGGFITLAAEIPSLKQAEQMLEVFNRDFRTKFLAPSVAKTAPGFVPNSYWRGSTWINENYWVAIGFLKYARKAAASGNDQLAKKFYQASLDICNATFDLAKSGLFEYYSSETGAPEGPDQFTWSGLALNLTYTAEEIRLEMGRIP